MRIEYIERIIPPVYLNFIILFIRIISTVAAVFWCMYNAQSNDLVYYIFLGLIYIYILFYIIRITIDSKYCHLFCFFTFFVDQFVITYFMYNTGGIYSVFYSGYFVIISIASILLGLSYGLFLALAASVFILYLGISVSFNTLDLVYKIIPLFIIALPSGVISEYMAYYSIIRENLKNELEEKNLQLTKYIKEIDSLQKQLIEQEKRKILETFTEDMSHVLKNPLMSIGGIADILDRKIKEGKIEDIDKYIERIKNESKKLNVVLNNVLQISDGKMVFEDLNIIALFDGIIADFKKRIKNLNFNVNMDGHVKFVKLDKKKFTVVINNVIDSLLETKKDSTTIYIQSYQKTISNKKILIIEISNRQYVIPQAILNNIFEPFVSGGSTKKGIALPVVKNIINLHGGTVDVESDENGTIFKISLPIL
ncbi:sensor histidine kinase [Desulfurella amilsii]|uniref:sensor histidine kinase n=1 Tax=Desulfurella amilsii TaxID=1562698 RepID=UPI000A3262BB|nr:HAMP domain-containing sensor histidine kinase [Desulfurella amilsii]